MLSISPLLLIYISHRQKIPQLLLFGGMDTSPVLFHYQLATEIVIQFQSTVVCLVSRACLWCVCIVRVSRPCVSCMCPVTFPFQFIGDLSPLIIFWSGKSWSCNYMPIIKFRELVHPVNWSLSVDAVNMPPPLWAGDWWGAGAWYGVLDDPSSPVVAINTEHAHFAIMAVVHGSSALQQCKVVVHCNSARQ